MNQRGIEILVQAALSGHPQKYGILHGENRDCALGLLHIALHDNRVLALQCINSSLELCEMCEMFGLSQNTRYCRLCQKQLKNEVEELIHLNDDHQLDFLTIARTLEASDA